MTDVDELAGREANLWAQLTAARTVLRAVHQEWIEALAALNEAMLDQVE
jgi:hypothetical protein